MVPWNAFRDQFVAYSYASECTSNFYGNDSDHSDMKILGSHPITV